MTAYARDKVSKENVEVPTIGEQNTLAEQVNINKNDITDLKAKGWTWAFNLASGENRYIDFTSKATSTLLILTQHDSVANCNSLFLVRKTANDNQDAMILGNAGGITQSGSSTMPVRATVVEVQGSGVKRVAIRSQDGGAAIVYYQIIE